MVSRAGAECTSEHSQLPGPRKSAAAKSNAKTPLRTAAGRKLLHRCTVAVWCTPRCGYRILSSVSTRSPAARTAVSPDVKSSKRYTVAASWCSYRNHYQIASARWPCRRASVHSRHAQGMALPYLGSGRYCSYRTWTTVILQQRQTPIRIAAPAATSVKTAVGLPSPATVPYRIRRLFDLLVWRPSRPSPPPCAVRVRIP